MQLSTAVRWRNSICTLQRQLKRAILGAESLQHPAEWIAGHIIQLIIPALLSLIAVFLLFPFTWLATLLDAAVFILATVFFLIVIKPQTSKAFALRWWGIFTVTLLFSATCLFIILPKPLYIASLETTNPFKSEVHLLKGHRQAIGTALLLSSSDWVRNRVASLLSDRYPATFRILERTNYENGSYFSLPVLKDFINDGPKEPGQVSWKESIYFPSTFFVRGVNLRLPPLPPHAITLITEHDGNMEFYTSGWKGGSLFNFAYNQSPAAVPWDGVRIQNECESYDAIYSASLDRALGFLASGKSDDALDALDDAASSVPKSNLEAARLVALQYIVVEGSFRGNLGKLQSLPFLHRSYDLFFEARKDPRFSQNDPLTIWLRETLMEGYEDLDWSFYERVLRLRDILTIDHPQKSHFDLLQQSLAGKSADEILNVIKTSHYSIKDLYFIKNLVVSDMAMRAICGVHSTGALEGGEEAAMSKMIRGIKEILPTIQYIDGLLANNRNVGSDLLTTRILKFVVDEWPKVMGTTNESDFNRLIAQDSKASSDLRDLGRLELIVNNTASNAAFLDGRNYEYSRLEYWLWFAHWSEDAVIEIDEHVHPERTDYSSVRRDMHQLIAKVGADSFIKDRAGKGRTFWPGLFCYAWYGETFDIPGNQELKQEFESETLIPFDSFLSSLHHSR